MANIQLPKGRSLSSEYAQTLSAQQNILPNMLASQAEWQPVQSSTQLANLRNLMLGTDAMDYNTRVFTPSVYRQGGNYSYGKLPDGVQGQIEYPSLPDSRGGGGGGGGGGIWLPPGVPGIPGISGGSSGMMKLKSSRIGGGNDGGVRPGYNGLSPAGGNTKSAITSNSYPGSIGSYNGMPLPPTPLGPLDPFSSLFGGGDSAPPRRLVSPSGYSNRGHHQDAQMGLLELYRNYMAPQLEAAQEETLSSQRASDIADVADLGPAALAAIKASDPETAALIEEATRQAQSELQMGGNLTPAQLRQATQSVRSRRTGMLGGTGSAGDLGEAMGIGAYGQQLQGQRRGYAQNVLGQRQSVYGDSFQRILGRPGAGLGAAGGAMNQAIGLGGQQGPMSLLNPESKYAGDIYNGNWNALVNGAIGNANNQNALIGAGISAVGSLGGAAMGRI